VNVQHLGLRLLQGALEQAQGLPIEEASCAEHLRLNARRASLARQLRIVECE
jgi:hypothetical protein